MNDVKKVSCLILKDKNILLVKNNAGKWSLPGGDMQDDEPEEELASESSEKLIGAKPKIIQLFEIYEFQQNQKNYFHSVFESELIEGQCIEESGLVKWFNVAKAKKLDLSEGTNLVLDEI